MRLNEALWYAAPGRIELKPVDDPTPGSPLVTVTAHYSGLSRGTERLVLQGRVPASERERMRCPHQDGEFPFPVKYGYALAGVVTDGPQDLIGQSVFALHPHQRRAHVPVSALHRLPEGLPIRRACLAANMETALNITWDAEIGPGDRVLIIGGGVLGLLTAGAAAHTPGAVVTVTDIDPTRATLAERMGAAFALPGAAPKDQDIVIHTSATESGLRQTLDCAAFEGKIVEASWFGDTNISLPLGQAFHSRRLRLISSQVGTVAPTRRAEWSRERRMAAALELLCDARYDALITGEIDFADAPAQVPAALDRSGGLMTVLRYA
ncbi:MAG: zinc-binding alcohol dehydrogenase [Rhodospirillaceae bacterium]|nr:zinc-binding alcohol dehydrogenase [Rhodospirillaceae bacterium]